VRQSAWNEGILEGWKDGKAKSNCKLTIEKAKAKGKGKFKIQIGN